MGSGVEEVSKRRFRLNQVGVRGGIMKSLLSPQKKTRLESKSASPRRPAREPPLLPTAALSEALSVLVCDVEEHADDACRAMGDVGGGRKAQACMARARHSLEELKKQAKKTPRGELTSCRFSHRAAPNVMYTMRVRPVSYPLSMNTHVKHTQSGVRV